MHKNTRGQLITFNLSFDQWKRYFWMEFRDCRGNGRRTDNTIPAIAKELHDAYEKSVLPDNSNLMDDVFCLLLEAEVDA